MQRGRELRSGTLVDGSLCGGAVLSTVAGRLDSETACGVPSTGSSAEGVIACETAARSTELSGTGSAAAGGLAAADGGHAAAVSAVMISAKTASRIATDTGRRGAALRCSTDTGAINEHAAQAGSSIMAAAVRRDMFQHYGTGRASIGASNDARGRIASGAAGRRKDL